MATMTSGSSYAGCRGGVGCRLSGLPSRVPGAGRDRSVLSGAGGCSGDWGGRDGACGGRGGGGGLVGGAVRTWTGELVDLGGRNTLLYYRDLRQGTLDIGPGSAASVLAVDALLSSRPVRLSVLFGDAAVGAAGRRARTVR